MKRVETTMRGFEAAVFDEEGVFLAMCLAPIVPSK
jgi:hypothetical protein